MLKKFCFLSLLMMASLSAQTRAVIFDFGGVLTDNSAETNREIIAEFLRDSLDVSKGEFKKLNEKRRRDYAYKGTKDIDFWRHQAKKMGKNLSQSWEENFYVAIKKAVGVQQEIYDLVDRLKEKGMRVGLMSNIDERLAFLVRKAGCYEPFDPCLLSCEMGVEKPDVKAYFKLLKKLDLPAEDVFFIDDKRENVKAAREVGIDAVLFDTSEQIQEELSKRGIL